MPKTTRCIDEMLTRLKGDMDDESSLKTALDGSYAVFAITNCMILGNGISTHRL